MTLEFHHPGKGRDSRFNQKDFRRVLEWASLSHTEAKHRRGHDGFEHEMALFDFDPKGT